jgi:hypothetical protein
MSYSYIILYHIINKKRLLGEIKSDKNNKNVKHEIKKIEKIESLQYILACERKETYQRNCVGKIFGETSKRDYAINDARNILIFRY